jgi:segregation and condensation protein A
MMYPYSDSVRIKLELFEGPLDLLLHLIRGNQIDISAINISEITDQYLEAIELMKNLDLDIAGEYLVMAATLLLIKSRMLLPPKEGIIDESDDDDPRAVLIQRLREYELFKQASHKLEQFESSRSQLFSRPISNDHQTEKEWVIDVSIVDLLKALQDVIKKRKDTLPHVIRSSPVSVRQTMTEILERLKTRGPQLFSELFDDIATRQAIIAVFLAVLELVRIRAVRARQRVFMGPIRLVAARHGENGHDNG